VFAMSLEAACPVSRAQLPLRQCLGHDGLPCRNIVEQPLELCAVCRKRARHISEARRRAGGRVASGERGR